jgi:hypothetical protein
VYLEVAKRDNVSLGYDLGAPAPASQVRQNLCPAGAGNHICKMVTTTPIPARKIATAKSGALKVKAQRNRHGRSIAPSAEAAQALEIFGRIDRDLHVASAVASHHVADLA